MKNGTGRTGVQTKEVREAILDATDRLLAQYGYQKMTIDDLAKEVGIGKGSIYLHFKSKEEIALSHIDRIIHRVCGKLREIAASNDSHEKKLRSMTLTRVTFRFDAVQHYTKSISELLSSLRDKLLIRRKSYHKDEAKVFEEIIADGQEQGVFIKGDARNMAHSFLLATNSVLPFSLSVRELGEREEIEKRTLFLTDMLLRGIKK